MHEDVGMYAYHLVDLIAERFLDLVDDLDDEIDELEDMVGPEPVRVVGRRLRELRQDVRGIRRTLTPTRDAVRRIVDDRVELDEGELFPRPRGDRVRRRLRQAPACDRSPRILPRCARRRPRLSPGQDRERPERGDEAADGDRVTAAPPHLHRGLYGQNFRHIPELAWGYGYWWSWGWIILTTIGQLAFFRWKRWI